MTVNVPLLRKTLEHITEHPEEWKQGYWAQRVEAPCGTAYCLAGHAVLMSGYDVNWSRSDGSQKRMAASLTNGERIPQKAAELLGLPTSDHEMTSLFDGDNTLRDIYREANRLTDGEIPIPDTLPDGS